jgi:hypothetical protein
MSKYFPNFQSRLLPVSGLLGGLYLGPLVAASAGVIRHSRGGLGIEERPAEAPEINLADPGAGVK